MKYRIFDAHCDTASLLFETGGRLFKNEAHIDCERMRVNKNHVQVFAAFVDKMAIKESPYMRARKILEFLKSEIKACSLGQILSASDLWKDGAAALFSIEGGEAIEGSLKRLEEFFNMGVRMMTLTWNYRNEIADGIGESDGMWLTKFGIAAVRKMNELGMVVDVSHISRKGFWDVARESQKPFVASHSNVAAICAHPRNLTDEQIKEIIKTNGVIGINFYPLFLDNSGKCDIKRILDHIDYILDMGGENNIGLGSDFDGIDCLPRGMSGTESIGTLISLMEKRGYGEELIKKITFDNFKRVLKANFLK